MKKFFLTILIFAAGSLVAAQESNVSVGYVQTTLEKNAVNFAVDYAKKLQPNLELFKAGSRSLYSFTPDLKILVGSNDVFNGITAKYVGNIMVFDTTSVAGVHGIPDLSRTFHNFPVSVGMETNQTFSFINGLVEAGYVPWYQTDKRISSIIRQTKVGIFLQGGYKFSTSDTTRLSGGATDQSNENIQGNILRAKLIIGFSPVIYFDKAKQLGVSVIGNSTTWYDILHSRIYYKLEGKLRLLIAKDYFVDFGYEKGSGAPNFNQGEQFTANLAVRF